MKYLGLATQPHDFPCPSLFVPIIQHGDFAERLFGDLWLAFGQAGQEEERLLNIRSEHRQAEDLRDAWLADVSDGGEVLKVANLAGS